MQPILSAADSLPKPEKVEGEEEKSNEEEKNEVTDSNDKSSMYFTVVNFPHIPILYCRYYIDNSDKNYF